MDYIILLTFIIILAIDDSKRIYRLYNPCMDVLILDMDYIILQKDYSKLPIDTIKLRKDDNIPRKDYNIHHFSGLNEMIFP